ncbi:ferritin-like domain-containing protein [Halomonas sp. M4R5S39]|uniref:ferritin-like domain-containing protein n=1 Tax=Halomonas kalidii TaxID=3043293 RepID=UPI0024A9396B|nr:ferritin-like domain-containing protein [Halomonas kalidii]MDI5986470.1 ferritin-like domain-containing protein [Halomonas kalidii]
MAPSETVRENLSPGLFDRLASTSEPALQDLREAAQLALQVEFTTIPVYLSALYSISDTGSHAYQTLRSVAMEEMFHVNQAANIIVALGALPKFTGDAVPTFPGYLPQANPNTTPMVGLFRASPDVFANVFAAIESPAQYGAPPQGDNYDSIAQLYGALIAAVNTYPGNPFSTTDVPGRQRTNIYLGKFGGNVNEVVDKESFHVAVNEIVEQGEGTVPPEKPLVPVESFGTYNHYGKRTDGTYGPILGTPYEMSHFLKFREVSLDSANFPATLPIISNPDSSDYTNQRAKRLSDSFDHRYSLMLRAFEAAFKDDAPDPYFNVVLSIMHRVLPHLARALMSTPAFADGDSSVGPNAAPAWRYRSDTGRTFEELTQELEGELYQLSTSPRDNALRTHLKAAIAGDKEILTAAKELGL